MQCAQRRDLHSRLASSLVLEPPGSQAEFNHIPSLYQVDRLMLGADLARLVGYISQELANVISCFLPSAAVLTLMSPRHARLH